MSHRVPMHVHERGITIALGPLSVTIPDGSDDDSTAAATTAAPAATESSSSSKSAKSTKTPKDATTSDSTVASSSFPNIAAPSTTSSSSSISLSSISSSTSSITSTSAASRTSQTAAAASTSAAASSSHSGGTSPGLVAFAVIVCIAFVGAIAWVVIMRRHHKQREWTFQQHQRIFERFDKSKDKEDDNNIRPDTSQTANGSIYPPLPVAVVDDGKAWSVGTGASVITTGPSVVRKLDWDQGPEKTPKSIIEAKPKRKPVPPPKELMKKKTFSQYLPYLLPQNHSAEVIELGKAEQQVYDKPIYRPAG